MPKARVLICDDNPALQKSLTGYFEAENMEVVYADTGEEALERLREEEIDLLILDVMLPGISGTEVCLEVRKTSDMPILMLSAKGEEIDRIVGLEVGADDYVTKPFSPREVVIRSRKLLKRRTASPESEKKYILAELTLLPDSYEVYIGEQRVNLATKEFEVLRYLVSHAGKPMTREHIINAVWGYEYAGDPRIVDTLIKRLRHKLSSAAEEPVHFAITTIFGVGYKAEELP
ncbi:MAG: response regulator transcription factor [Oscillospiraceae bacterium]